MSTTTTTLTESPHVSRAESIRLAPARSGRSLQEDTHTAPVTYSSSKRELFVREASCHITLAIAGWSDASSGPLIPYIQAYFGITYTIVSILFIVQCIGYGCAAALNGYLQHKFGLGRVITAGAMIQILGYALLIPAWAYPLMPVCYAVIGFGMALQDASANTYVATLPNVEHKMAFLHASYGLGAVVCPLAATAFASSGIKFSYFYCISVSLAALDVLLCLYAFKFKYRIEEAPMLAGTAAAEAESIALQAMVGGERDAEKNSAPPSPTATRSGGDHSTSAAREVEEEEELVAEVKKGQFAEMASQRAVWLFAIFIVLYVGAEVSMGGWIVTFVIDNRNGGPSAGYIATGYWLGIFLGRLTLSWLTVRVGEKRILFAYLIIAIGLEFGIMYSASLAGNGVMVGLVGYVMGPSYPIVMSIVSKVIPRRLLAGSIGFIAAIGAVGGALFPFTTGALSQRFSPAALQPVMIILLGLQLLIWCFVPSPRKKVEGVSFF